MNWGVQPVTPRQFQPCMQQTNKLNLASDSANEHKRDIAIVSNMEIFFLSIRQVSLRSRSDLTNEIYVGLILIELVSVYIQQKLIKCAVLIAILQAILSLCVQERTI